MGKSSRQKTNKETLDLNDTLDQMDLTDILGTFHSKQQNVLPFQVPIEYSLKIDHVRPENKSQFKRTEIMLFFVLLVTIG